MEAEQDGIRTETPQEPEAPALTEVEKVLAEEDANQPDVNKTLEDMQAKLSDLEKANSGLQKGISSIREEKNQYRNDYNGLVSKIDEKFKEHNAAKEPEEPEPKRMAVKFDENDQPYVDTTDFETLINTKITKNSQPVQSKVTELENRVNYTSELDANKSNFENLLESDAAYKEAFKTIAEQSKDMTPIVEKYCSENGIKIGPGDMGTVLEITDNQELMKEFHVKHPNSDPSLILQAMVASNPKQKWTKEGARMIKMALKSVKPVDRNSAPGDISNLFGRPANMSTSTGGKKVEDMSIEDKLANMPMDDFLNLNDKDYEALKGRMGGG